MTFQEAWHVYPLVCDHDKELTRKSMEAVASASCGEPMVAVGQRTSSQKELDMKHG